MKTTKHIRFICGLVIGLLLPAALGAQAAGNAVVRHFVQGFYDWYVPNILSDIHIRGTEFALKQRGSDFEVRLAAALRKDDAKQARSSYIVGLDFDPFLASQDPCEHYEAGAVTRDGEKYLVAVYSVCDGRRVPPPM